jgi:4-diphosphocytidyl-2-C-methyl-D-erythritol kinase
VVPAGKPVSDELTVTGIDIKTRQDKNLVIKAVRLLREKYPVPFLKIHLHKAIPSGAGLGGGSSDAACILKSINRCFNLSLSDDELRVAAMTLGSDCPFFINPEPSVARGRGEKLTPISPVLEGYYAVLINPGIHISTREAYMNSKPSEPETSLEKLITYSPSEWIKAVYNDFEDYVFRLYPQIGEIKRSLYRSGALYASMSGSGSTLYGIFRERPEINKKIRNHLIWEGLL